MGRKVRVDMYLFNMAFGRDVDFHDKYPQSVYLELDTGNVLWVYENDGDASFEGGISEAENKENRDCLADNPECYLEIPGFSHGGHHQILQDFLESKWTDDKELWLKVKKAYFGSIGGWAKEVNDDSIRYSYFQYRDSIIKKEALEFLNNHGIEPINNI